MNGTEEAIKYGGFYSSYNSPPMGRQTAGSYDFPDKSPKKDKKWSLGSLFRRRKKVVSDSSSEEEQKKGFLQKKKPERRKRTAKTVGTFDHVVLSPRSSFYPANQHPQQEPSGVFSDPQISYSSYSSRALPKLPSDIEIHRNNQLVVSKESLKSNSPGIQNDSLTRKSRRVLKARIEAGREKLESSSDEDSQRSLSSSRLRSDDSCSKSHRDGSLSRRSRAARTERYLRRHSKDEENFNQLRVSKSDAEAKYLAQFNEHNYLKRPLPRSPVGRQRQSDMSGLSTIPPSHATNVKYKLNMGGSNSSLKTPYKPYNETNLRSCSYDGIHRGADVVHGHFPIGVYRSTSSNNSSLMDVCNNNSKKQPPPPPPRDPKRLNLLQYLDNSRPTSYSFENGYNPSRNTTKTSSFNVRPASRPPDQFKGHSFNLHPSYRSTSEDQLPVQPLLHDLLPRPSSATPEMSSQQRQSRRLLDAGEHYNYLMDKHPRSRKPIVIQQQVNGSVKSKPADFWRQKEKDQLNAKTKELLTGKDFAEVANSKVEAKETPKIFTSKTHVSTKVFLPNVNEREKSPFKPISPVENHTVARDVPEKPKVVDRTNQKFKASSNLEEALDELEAIYNSLQLGDENLLDRAEEREKSAAALKLQESKEKYPDESFDTVDNPRQRRLRRSKAVDLKGDDMAFRKMNKERSATISDPQSVISNVSYLLSSPVYNSLEAGELEHPQPKVKSKEPDVTLDDVVFRSISHTNNSLKVIDPQPPFGIPLGPVPPAANSDYLHAVPEHGNRPTFRPRKIPNIVNDDLAFRNLRKDGNKSPALPPVSGDDYVNNNNVYNKNVLKKNRAARSLSANIFDYNKDSDHENEFKNENLDDIADVMEIARQVLREKENRINATKKGFLSDTDASKYLEKTSNQPKSNTLNNSRNSFLNQMRFGLESNCDKYDVKQKLQIRVPLLGDEVIQSKPPRGLTPERISRSPTKESTPIPVSHFEDRSPVDTTNLNTSFDDMLAALAMEARETSDRITNELNMLVEAKEPEKQLDEEEKVDEAKVSLDVQEKMCEIVAVSESAKLCDKFLESTAGSKEDISSLSELETIDSLNEKERVPSPKVEAVAPKAEFESDHDYENMVSEYEEATEEINQVDETGVEDAQTECTVDAANAKCVGEGGEAPRLATPTTPFETALIGTTARWPSTTPLRPSPTRRRRRNLTHPPTDADVVMSESGGTRADRVARYKAERRAQLAAQYGARDATVQASSPAASSAAVNRLQRDSSGSSEGPRTTRASRLRAAAAAAAAAATQEGTAKSEEKTSTNHDSLHAKTRITTRTSEKDKSSKRKSNLNRSLTSEEVPSTDPDESRAQRRRRRLMATPSALTGCFKNKSDTCLTASSTSATSPINAASRVQAKRTDLGLHMENARRGLAPPFSEMVSVRRATPPRGVVASGPKPKGPSCDSNHKDSVNRVKVANKENIEDGEPKYVNFSKKMEELAALTKESLARIEQLQNRNRTRSKFLSKSDAESSDSSKPFSILKKKPTEEPVEPPQHNSLPVSILKRKSVQDELKAESGAATSSNTPPVTFSPSVVEPASTNRKQGILKKRRSLDESQVMRHRSCSPDVENNTKDSRSILKSQRRSSLEEINRMQSPDSHLHGILKRKASRSEDDPTQSLNSPQGILKRKSGSNSAGASHTTHHVSIATAVILAAAGGAEIVLDSAGETVKPILKKKSFSEDHPIIEADLPKPILKKKSSTETDDSEERPKKPILKVHRNSDSSDSRESKPFRHIYHQNSSDSSSDRDVRPILKQSHRDEHSRPKLTFFAKPNTDDAKPRGSRRPNTICGEMNFNVNGGAPSATEDREMTKPRPLSVSELVMSFEKKPIDASTGAVPKKSSLKRNSDRYRTQPVTHNELEASRRLLRDPSIESLRKHTLSTTEIKSDFELTSLDNDNTLSTTVLSSTSPDSGLGHKLSSDSAFQSLGDCLELDQQPEERPDSKMDHSKLEFQMKAIAEEAKKRRLRNVAANDSGASKSKNFDRSSPRFSTQPVTVDELQDAARLKQPEEEVASDGEEEPSNMSLSERIKMFNMKVTEQRSLRREMPRRRLNRFQTQPVTSEEVESALCIPQANALDDVRSSTTDDTYIRRSPSEASRRGILKPTSRTTPKSSPRHSGCELATGRLFASSSPRPILKQPSVEHDYANDEGISSDDESTGPDEEDDVTTETEKYGVKLGGTNQTRRKHLDDDDATPVTSDGESSGGREVQSIIANGLGRKRVKDRSCQEYSILKSKSHCELGNEVITTKPSSGLQRSSTASAMAIAELQAKLQRSGECDWKKRHLKLNTTSEELKNLYNDENLSDKLSILTKKDELDASSRKWRSRVEKKDAEQFTVSGRMQEIKDVPNLNISSNDKNKRTPNMRRFKGKDGGDVSSLPSSPNTENNLSVKRSFSVPGSKENSNGEKQQIAGIKVAVIQPDDETFKSFFKSVDANRTTAETILLSLDDLDSVTRETNSLLVQKKNVTVQKRRGATRNPIKTLATTVQIQNEYTEIMSSTSEREARRLNIAKLKKNSHLAIEALAGLASSEDFTSIALKKNSGPSQYLPYKNPMLLQVKGRRHIQTRLVEPSVSSINQGDNFILVTSTAVYNYIGKYSNIIEQSRAVDVAAHIQQKRDLGCRCEGVVSVNERSAFDFGEASKFWKVLGNSEGAKVAGAGHPDEDELFESRIIDTNMVFEVKDNELVPYTEYWGTIPKIKMLDPSKVLVFDFGTEMYVWSGKLADPEEKKLALKLAKEMWDEGYNYSECTICPINVASLLGNRTENNLPFKANSRPEWGLFAKITQHAETILFKEKFLDWPDYTRVIKVKTDEKNDTTKSVDASFELKPCDVAQMLKGVHTEPDLIIEGTHLGRGKEYFDDGTNRLFEFNTLEITIWRILENTYEKLEEASYGEFYDRDSYIVRWRFRMIVMGRELSGRPSKYAQSGRDRYVYFCWQGANASVNEKGAAALLTVELDSENAPQIRVAQNAEPPAFLRLFEGGLVVHKGKRDDNEKVEANRLYIVRGEVEDEAVLMEVPCSMRQLRSRTSLVLVNAETNAVTLWHGCKSSEQTRKVAKRAVGKIVDRKPVEFDFAVGEKVNLEEVEEGSENESFKKVLGKKSELYYSLLKRKEEFNHTLRLYSLSSTLGAFQAVEVLNPQRSEHVCPYPFMQSELYTANQPALFLLDNEFELWIWQGWWPEREEDVDNLDQTGSGAVRWQYERRAAMQTAVNYWHEKHGASSKVVAYLVWAGLEPLEFTNLFPTWENMDDVAELNINEGRKAGDAIPVEKELAILTRTSYPLVQLQQRPLPEGVDPTHLEIYLSADEFEESFSMSKEDFAKLPSWRQTDLKKENGLF